MEKKVSVILAVYNCADTLDEAIHSIVNQTYSNWELIICNDASTDDTKEIVEKYKNKFSEKIKLLENIENKGLSFSLNQCLKYASGEYVARMDGDDISLLNRFEKQVSFLNQNPEMSVVGSSMIRFDEKGEYGILKSIPKPNKYSLKKGVPFYHATIMMRKSTYVSLGGYTVSKRTIRGQDVDLWFRFYSKDFMGANIEEGLYKVREDEKAYKRRKIKYSIDFSKTLFMGFNLLNFPLRYYPYITKPVISSLIPYKIKYYRNKNLMLTRKHMEDLND